MAGLPWEDAHPDATPWGALQNAAPPAKVAPATTPVLAPPTAPGPSPQASPGASSGPADDYVGLVGEGIPRGALALLGLPASADEYLSDKARQYLPKSVSDAVASPPGGGLHSVLPDVGDVNQWLTSQEKQHGLDVAPPQTAGGRFAQAAGEGIGGGLAGGAGALGPIRAAISGAGSGLGSQAGAELFPGSDIAPVIGGLLGGAVPSGGARAAGEAVARNPAGQLVEETLSPTSVDASSRAAEALIRGHLGEANRDTAITANELAPLRIKISTLPEADRLNLVHYMETRSTGSAPAIPKELQGVADAARDAYQLRATKLSNLSEYAKRQFIDDYYPHMWEDQAKARAWAQGFGGKEGSGKNLKARSIPTVADGIAAGLKPVTTDPIQTTLNYVANMDRFIATKQVFENGTNNGLIKVIPAGKTPPQDWVKLNTYVGKKGLGSEAYAPAGFARVYNNFMSKGFYGNDTSGKWYDALQHVNGGINALQLGLSAFHLSTMAQEGVVNGVAKGLQEAFSGSPLKGALSIATAPAGPVSLAFKGGNLLREYVQPGSSRDPVMREITDLAAKANANPSQLTKDLRSSNAGSYWDAVKRGTLRMELAADVRGMRNAPITGTAKAFFNNVGRTLDTVAQPMFEKYIPRLKAGAFYDNMKSWMEANPNATQEEKVATARKMWDSVDNRFGEMNHDNLFWNQTLKQAARLAMRSYSWTLGTMREIGGGVSDIAGRPSSLSMKSPEFSPRAAYAVALPLTYGALMAAYQYMKTGQAPQDMHDLLAARTGGTDAATQQPERVELPSYMKDVFGWAQSPSQEVSNKMSPLLTTAKEMATGNDYKQQPIADANADTPTWVGQWLQHMAESYLPISVQQFSQGAKTGSNISTLERALNVRPANRFLTDPGGYEAMMKKVHQRAWAAKKRSDAKQASQYGGIE